LAFANVSDLVATTIEKRSKKIANNVLGHNAVLSKLSASGKVKTFSGGTKIYEELSFAENGNAGFYSGYDALPVAPQDVISAAEYNIKQAACPVIVSGLEQLINAGPEKFIDLVEARMEVAEDTMKNLITNSIYSNGTGSGGKELDGLAKLITAAGTGTVGGIDPGTWSFWTNKTATGVTDVALGAATNIVTKLNTLWPQLVRGGDRPDLIVLGTTLWRYYLGSLQPLQRFSGASTGATGFPTLKYMEDCDVVFDNVAALTATIGYVLNSKYLKFRPHADRNFTSLDPKKRYAINQDAEVQILAFAGNMTMSGRKFQGRIEGT
jgi:hypothetical protein